MTACPQKDQAGEHSGGLHSEGAEHTTLTAFTRRSEIGLNAWLLSTATTGAFPRTGDAAVPAAASQGNARPSPGRARTRRHPPLAHPGHWLAPCPAPPAASPAPPSLPPAARGSPRARQGQPRGPAGSPQGGRAGPGAARPARPRRREGRPPPAGRGRAGPRGARRGRPPPRRR